jgi:hypothetical protein
VTGVCQNGHIVAHFDEAEIDQRAEIAFTHRRQFQPLCFDIPKRPAKGDCAFKVEFGEGVVIVRHKPAIARAKDWFRVVNHFAADSKNRGAASDGTWDRYCLEEPSRVARIGSPLKVSFLSRQFASTVQAESNRINAAVFFLVSSHFRFLNGRKIPAKANYAMRMRAGQVG